MSSDAQFLGNGCPSATPNCSPQGLNALDALCQTETPNEGLGGSYIAWVATVNASAASRLDLGSSTTTFTRVDGLPLWDWDAAADINNEPPLAPIGWTIEGEPAVGRVRAGAADAPAPARSTRPATDGRTAPAARPSSRPVRAIPTHTCSARTTRTVTSCRRLTASNSDVRRLRTAPRAVELFPAPRGRLRLRFRPFRSVAAWLPRSNP